MSAPRINWEAVRAEYIAGDDGVTHEALCAKHHCCRQTVSDHSRKEGWDAARRQYRDSVATKTLNKVSTTEAEMRARQIKQAQYLQHKALTAMKTLDPTDFPQALRALESGMDQERKAAGIAEEHHVRGEIEVSDDRQSVRSKLLPELAIGGAGQKAE